LFTFPKGADSRRPVAAPGGHGCCRGGWVVEHLLSLLDRHPLFISGGETAVISLAFTLLSNRAPH